MLKKRPVIVAKREIDMREKNVIYQLNKLGYTRTENHIESIPGKTLRKENYRAKMLNHTIMEHIRFVECDFTEASVTGSIFRHCKFINCDFYQADFEYCEFYGCTFESNIPIMSSFNASSFVETEFLQIHFRSCTFTGAFFYECLLDKVQIELSTMENALLRQCRFSNINFCQLNMDYIEFDRPQMENVILSINQIPFIFGVLQYLRHTADPVKVSKAGSGSMTAAAFFKNVVPLLCSHFNKTEQFFPLANIYYSLGENEKGYKAITKGLVAAISIRDFRMIKHFCKLIASTGAFQPSALHNLYHNYICRLYPQNGIGADIPNYARHILDIKALLFSTAQKASFHMTFRTNIELPENWKLKECIERVLSLPKCDGAFQDSDVEVVLRQNSPLQITVQLSGNEEQLAELLLAYLSLAGIEGESVYTLPVACQSYQMLTDGGKDTSKLKTMARTYREDLQKMDIQIILLEYYVENFRHYCDQNGPVYYFNSSAVQAVPVLTSPMEGSDGSQL